MQSAGQSPRGQEQGAGFGRIADTDLRPGHPLLGTDGWRAEWLRLCRDRACVVALDADASGERRARDLALERSHFYKKMRSLGIGGLSVTMPHKAAVASLVDELTDDARRRLDVDRLHDTVFHQHREAAQPARLPGCAGGGPCRARCPRAC